jgi:hypothetical protein
MAQESCSKRKQATTLSYTAQVLFQGKICSRQTMCGAGAGMTDKVARSQEGECWVLHYTHIATYIPTQWHVNPVPSCTLRHCLKARLRTAKIFLWRGETNVTLQGSYTSSMHTNNGDLALPLTSCPLHSYCLAHGYAALQSSLMHLSKSHFACSCSLLHLTICSHHPSQCTSKST